MIKNEGQGIYYIKSVIVVELAIPIQIQAEVVKSYSLPAGDGFLEAVDAVENLLVRVLLGVGAGHALLKNNGLVTSCHFRQPLNKFRGFLLCNKGGRPDSVHQYLDLRIGQASVLVVVSLLMAHEGVANIVAVVGQGVHVLLQGPPVTGYPQLQKIFAELEGGAGMILVCFLLQYFQQSYQFDLLCILLVQFW